MKITPMALPEVLLITPARHGDERGWFSETFRQSALEEAGERGRKLVEERFTWERIVDQHIGLFSWLSGRGPRPHHVAD